MPLRNCANGLPHPETVPRTARICLQRRQLPNTSHWLVAMESTSKA